MNDVYNKFKADIHRELIIELDSLGFVKTISHNGKNILGYDIGEIVGLNILNFIVGENIKFDRIYYKEKFEITMKMKNGGDKSFDAVVNSVLNQNQEVDSIFLSLIHIDSLRKIGFDNKEFLNILELSKDIIYMVQIKPEVKFLYLNSAVEEIIGIRVEEHYPDPLTPFRCAHPDDREIFMKKMNNQLDYSRPIQVRYRNIHGEYIWLEESVIPIYDEQRELVAIAGFCRDIQDRKELEENLKKIGYYDCLTEIKNRTYFQKELDKLDSQIDKEIGLIICDLDNLKQINDTLGHPQGDKLLKNFAKIIDEFSSENTISARIGGDEFAILLIGQPYNCLEDIYFKLLKSVENYNSVNTKLPVSVSIGFDYSQRSLGNTERVYSIADKKMYQEKLANKEAFTNNRN